jgi:hypothetical protein
MSAPPRIAELTERFEYNLDSYRKGYDDFAIYLIQEGIYVNRPWGSAPAIEN